MNASRPASLRRTLAVSLGKGLLLMAAILAFVVPMSIGGGFDPGELATDAEVMSIRPHVEDSPAALVATHDCWTGEAPADMQGVVPGHVVVTVDGTTRLGGERMVGKALAQIFEGADHGLRVAGFCR